MKKWASALLAGFIAFSLTACAGGGSQGTTAKGTDTSSAKSENASHYPEKPIIIVAPSGAGGGWDMTARSIAKVFTATKIVDQTITVENKPGGGGAVFMAEYATKQKNNPYELFVSSPPILINHDKKEGNSPYGYEDATPLAQLTRDYGAIAVKADSKYKDLKSLLDAIKADPKKITFAGGSAPGSMDHLVSVLPAFKYGVDPKAIKYVSYDGGGEAVAALLGGNADVLGTDASSLAEYLKAGKIRVLAVLSNERLSGIYKDVPTLKEQGIDAEFNIWRGIFGPKNMPEDVLKYWNEKLKALSDNDTWKKELQTNQWESDYKNADDFKVFLADQDKQVKDLLSALGMAK
jgi:putative tricarboxylic transport membrane protein